MSAHTETELAALRATAAADSPPQLLSFMLGTGTYALSILRIKEIIEYDKLTAVPMMPTAVRGVINLRGAVVPVIDIALRFGHAPTQAGRRTCIVIVETGGAERRQEVGLLVDAVNEVMDIAATDIEPPPAFGAHAPPGCIAGMGKTAAGFTIILDADSLLNGLDQAGATWAGSAQAAVAQVAVAQAPIAEAAIA